MFIAQFDVLTLSYTNLFMQQPYSLSATLISLCNPTPLPQPYCLFAILLSFCNPNLFLRPYSLSATLLLSFCNAIPFLQRHPLSAKLLSFCKSLLLPHASPSAHSSSSATHISFCNNPLLLKHTSPSLHSDSSTILLFLRTSFSARHFLYLSFWAHVFSFHIPFPGTSASTQILQSPLLIIFQFFSFLLFSSVPPLFRFLEFYSISKACHRPAETRSYRHSKSQAGEGISIASRRPPDLSVPPIH
jgi:hypothetical protein